jgi:uncharacterized protein (TIGR02145 family)
MRKIILSVCLLACLGACAQNTANCGTVTDYDGNTYQTVMLGKQCWMAENLRTTHYADGTEIAMGDGVSISIPYRYCPNLDKNNVPTYGYLYNWVAVMGGSASSNSVPSNVQGICPDGWHVPSYDEFIIMLDYVASKPQYQCDGNPQKTAKALASTTGWDYGGAKSKYSPGDNSQDNNATGFNAMPAGTGTGTESAWFGHDAWFWTTTGSDKGRGATSIRISYGSPTISRGNFYNGYFKENQFSVRCVRGSGTLNVEELFLRLNALAQRKNQSSHNTSKKSTVWDLFCYSKPADYSNVFLYPELYPELFIKSSSSSSDASSSSSTSQPTTTTPSNKLCERCHGSGREVRIDSGPCVGLDNKYCDECKQTVPCSHYHVTCQLCGGKGYR